MSGPVASLEFRRVCALPRRDWATAPDLAELRDGLTAMLRTAGGTMKLRDSQAAALRDIYDHRGLFGPIAVGEGKTLVSILAPVVCSAARPILLVPASVRDQTLARVLPEMARHWQLHPRLRVVGYSELSLAHNAKLLDEYEPDMIIADECHLLKNRRSGRTRRVSRYMAAHPMTTFIALSGTVASFSILDYWHLIQWALKPDNSPVPSTYYDAMSWALALDERVHPRDRLPAGVLPLLTPGATTAREAYRARLVETPGVVATGENQLGTSLRLTVRAFEPPVAMVRMADAATQSWEDPDGVPIKDAVDVWRIARTVLAGFWYRWDPTPPGEWLEARSAWHKFVRDRIRYGRGAFDTELQVARASTNEPVLQAWARWRERFKPNVVPVWYSTALVENALAWFSGEPGIVWVEHVAVGEKLAELSGLPYFGAGDERICTARGQVIASIAAHGTGKNLQQWHRNLVVTPMTAGKAWEQLMGRTHRLGQQEDEVTFETYQHHAALVEALKQAINDATFLEQSLGNRQRLLYCDRIIP